MGSIQSINAAVHVHSTWSYDGKWELERIADTFHKRGYRVVLMSEHDRGFTPDRLAEFRERCQTLSHEACLLVPGLEYSDAANRVHTLTWGPIPFLGENQPTRDVLEEVQRLGGLSVFAHPTRRRAVECFRPDWATYLLGVEVFNRKADGFDWSEDGRGVQSNHPDLIPFASIDFHSGKQHFPAAMRLGLEGDVSESSVLDALAAGRAEARLLGLSARRFRTGPGAWLLRSAEWARTNALRTLRGGRDRRKEELTKDD